MHKAAKWIWAQITGRNRREAAARDTHRAQVKDDAEHERKMRDAYLAKLDQRKNK